MKNIDKEKRKSIANAQKVVDIIGKRMETKDKNKKIDLSSIAKDLADRREQVLKTEDGE